MTPNTDDTPARNTRRRGRCFLGTHNNPAEGDLSKLEEYAKQNWNQFVGQRETGESGTPHIQFAFQARNALYLTAQAKKLGELLGKPPHLEIAKNWGACKNYCRKSDTRDGETVEVGTSKIIFRDVVRDNGPNEFQRKILDKIGQEPDDRKIIWVVDEKGGLGKTCLARHLCIEGGWLYLTGKAADMKYAITQYLYTDKGDWRGRELKGVFMDMTRSQENYVSFQGIEEIKNGIFFNGKYHAMQVIYNPIHVVCMANFKPDDSKLSEDRWDWVFGPPITHFTDL